MKLASKAIALIVTFSFLWSDLFIRFPWGFI